MAKKDKKKRKKDKKSGLSSEATRPVKLPDMYEALFAAAGTTPIEMPMAFEKALFDHFEPAFDDMKRLREQFEAGIIGWAIAVRKDDLSPWKPVAPPDMAPYRVQSQEHAWHLAELVCPNECRQRRLGRGSNVQVVPVLTTGDDG